jgi:nucleotide-binding universal stress UspA family protein
VPAPILAAFDPVSEDMAPVWLAAAVASRTGAPLIVGAVSASGDSIDRAAGAQDGEDLPTDAEAEAALVRVTGTLLDAGIAAQTVSFAASTAPRGLAFGAMELGAAMLVAGSHTGAPDGRVAPGSTASRLLAGTPCAVAIAPPGWDRARPLTTIAAAFVDSAEGRAALHAAHAIARRAARELRVLTAVRPRAWMGDADEDELRVAAEQAAGESAYSLLGERVDVDAAVGEPAEVLLAAAAEVDLLVLGSRAYGPEPAALLGGVSRVLTGQAACPVVVLARGAPVAVGG